MVLRFYKIYFNMLVDLYGSQTLSRKLFFQGFAISHKYMTNFLRNISFCN